MAESEPTVPAYASLAALVLPPLAGAAVALVQDSWKPLGFGALCAAGLLVAFIVGSGVVDARKARRIALRARNEVHPDRGELEAEIDRLNGQVRGLAPRPCWNCGQQPVNVDASTDGGKTWGPVTTVARRRSESGERASDFTDPNVTRSPDPGHTEA